MQKKMIADMKFPYDGKELKAGEEFLAYDKDVFALSVYRRAHVDEGKEEPRTKRQYRRRDMSAENS